MQQTFANELHGQPQALSDLIAHYGANPVPSLATDGVLLTGMGASFHAAAITAYRLQREQHSAHAVEATELLNYPGVHLRACRQLVYISQSGSSAEIKPLFSDLSTDIETVAVTNVVDSPLARQAGTTLALCAGDEQTVATKTYINSLALLALLAGVTPQALQGVQTRIQQLLDAAETTRSLWLDVITPEHSLYFVGHGPHAITARHSAMMVGEWTKRPAVYASIGAFRHGFLEAVTPNTVVVIFAPPGVSQQSAFDLSEELTRYGTPVLLVENGYTRRVGDAFQGTPLDDEFLSPMVDVIPVQLFIEAFARQTNVSDGFRYISKVIQKL